MLKAYEKEILIAACEANTNLTLTLHEGDAHHYYRSRFLSFQNEHAHIVIDFPSAEQAGSPVIGTGTCFDGVFISRHLRFLFHSTVVGHTKISLGERISHALLIHPPDSLEDGDKREYFRVLSETSPPVRVQFFHVKAGEEAPFSMETSGKTELDMEGIIVDISGGGFSLISAQGGELPPMNKGDLILARFQLKNFKEPLEIWCDICNKRAKGNGRILYGCRYSGSAYNQKFKSIRNLIMRYVIQRQRELM